MLGRAHQRLSKLAQCGSIAGTGLVRNPSRRRDGSDEQRASAALDPEGVKLVRGVADDLGFSSAVIKTVAGHDALALQKRVPATLIFVPSRDGLSHNAREFTEPSALDKGLAVLTETLWRMVTAP